MKLKVAPPSWGMSWLLVGVAVGLFALLVFQVAERYL
jgi:hypothetical protein